MVNKNDKLSKKEPARLSADKAGPASSKADSPKTKLSFKEKREYEQLEIDIDNLENEKETLEKNISSGTLNNDELIEKSNRIGEIIKLLDEKSDRWLELSEFA